MLVTIACSSLRTDQFAETGALLAKSLPRLENQPDVATLSH